MLNNETFFDLISPRHLYLGAAFFAAITVVFVVLIFVRLRIKKKRFFARQEITAELNEWISTALVENTAQTDNISPRLQLYLRKPIHRQYIIDSLINAKKNISGAASANIRKLYEGLGLKNDSLSRLRSLEWHKRSRGIYELYMMGQRDTLNDIARYTNSTNETVRHEAQTATVGFNGFKGLAFLTTLIYPLDGWQQLKLLEQLNKLQPEDMPDLPTWLRSPNTYVQLFALKLTDIYQQLGMYNLVIDCLYSPSEQIRKQAVTTLGKIANSPPAVLEDIYPNETNANKRNILRHFGAIGSASDIPFLKAQLNDPDDSIKLEAGRAIVRCKGQSELEDAAGASDTHAAIVSQIKFEMKL